LTLSVAEFLPVKDVSSTTFGFLIAYLLPGFAGLFAISFFAPPVQRLFSQFVEAESNVGRFLLVILCSLVVGLEVSVARWLLFEKWLCRKHKRDTSKYRHLSNQSKLSAFRAAVDENYRYHQFWGGMAVVTPFVAWGVVSLTSGGPAYLLTGAFIALEVLNFVGGCSAYQNYVDSTQKILEGLEDGERLGAESTKDEAKSTSRHHAPISSFKTAPQAAAFPSIEATATAKTLTNSESCEVTSAENLP
jgi:hypothetical protein